MTAEPQTEITAPLQVGVAVAAAQERKAEDLRVLVLSELSDFTDYFLICTGRSNRQVQAIARSIEERLKEVQTRLLHREGLREGKWVLLDYGDLVVHVFDQERRDFYRLDLLWADAPELAVEGGPGSESSPPAVAVEPQ